MCKDTWIWINIGLIIDVYMDIHVDMDIDMIDMYSVTHFSEHLPNSEHFKNRLKMPKPFSAESR